MYHKHMYFLKALLSEDCEIPSSSFNKTAYRLSTFLTV